MHVVFRLGEEPLRLYRDLDDEDGWLTGHAVIGGARDAAYLRDVSKPAASVGAQLLPGAAFWLFGAPADELSSRHTDLEDLLGPIARRIREALLEAPSPEHRLEIFESFLTRRLSPESRLHPVVSMALSRFDENAELSEVVSESGHSHRHFIALFRQAVGLSPKRYLRIVRFQRAIEHVNSRSHLSLAHVALEAGFSDQSHFTREFRDIAKLSPSVYRALAPRSPNHVSVVNFLQDEKVERRQSRPHISSKKE